MIRRRSLAFLGAALLAGAVAPLVPAQAADKILKVGVSAGPYGDILREAGLAERDIQQLVDARCVRLPSTEEMRFHVS